MKIRSIGAGAMAMTAAAAFAQSSVTIGGVADAGITRIQGTGMGHILGMSSGGQAASRLFFRGTEDLSGGMTASFWLESLVLMDTGNPNGINFQRRATVSLSGPLGELRMGRDYALSYVGNAAFDAFGNRGVGSAMAFNTFSSNVAGVSTAIDSVRLNNSVGYYTPAVLGDFYGAVQYSFGSQPSGEPQPGSVNDRSGVYIGARVGYAKGPLQVAAAYGRYEQVGNAASTTAQRGDLTVANLGGSYDFGFVRPMFFYGQERLTGFSPARQDSLVVGLLVPIGVGEFRASIGRYDRKDGPNDFNKYAVGYGYNLSKRTQLYATYATLKNKGASARVVAAEGVTAVGVAAGGRSSGIDLGLRHSF